MLGDVAVQDAPTIMADDEKAIEHAESDGRNGEEIHGCNSFPVVAQKGLPAFDRFRILRRSFHPTRDGSLGNIEAEHEKLAMDAWGSPSRILDNHAKDQLPHFPRSLSSPDGLPDLGNQSPIQTETGPLPSGHRIGRGSDESLL